MSKQLAIVPAGGGEVKEVRLDPGATAGDVKTQAGLEGYLLSRPGSDVYFADSEVLYPVVRDGDKLVASLPAVVGSLPGPTAFLFLIGVGLALVLFICLLPSGGKSKNNRATGPSRSGSPSPSASTSSRRLHDSRLRVSPDTRPYWVQRAWRQNGNEYQGYYRTRFGSWKGRIVVRSARLTTPFIFDPPRELLQGPHRLCLRRVGRGQFKIHLSLKTTDVNSLILTVEKTIEEAHRCAILEKNK